MRKAPTVLFQKGTAYENPFTLLEHVEGEPEFEFRKVKKVDRKTGEIKWRLIANPNKASRQLHHLFLEALRFALSKMKNEARALITLPSATAFKPESWYVQNAEAHLQGEHFFITDVHNAYASVKLEYLSELLVYIFHYEEHSALFGHDAILHSGSLKSDLVADPLYAPLLQFLRVYFAGKFGEGLVFGGVASPFLFNLFMEAFVDSPLRYLIAKRLRHERITYTRYADDLVFSSKGYIGPDLRKRIEKVLARIGLSLNRQKTKVLRRAQGTVFVTKVGLERVKPELVFPKVKRKALRNRLHLFLSGQAPERDENNCLYVNSLRGYIADFLGYIKARGVPTKSDEKLLVLCRQFEEQEGRLRCRP